MIKGYILTWLIVVIALAAGSAVFHVSNHLVFAMMWLVGIFFLLSSLEREQVEHSHTLWVLAHVFLGVLGYFILAIFQSTIAAT